MLSAQSALHYIVRGLLAVAPVPKPLFLARGVIPESFSASRSENACQCLPVSRVEKVLGGIKGTC